MKVSKYVIFRPNDLRGLLKELIKMDFPLEITAMHKVTLAPDWMRRAYWAWCAKIARDLTESTGNPFGRDDIHAWLKEEYGIESISRMEEPDMKAYINWVRTYASQKFGVDLTYIYREES